jgi:transketolase
MTDETKRPVAEVAGDLDRLCIDMIRTLSLDAVQAANSGHPRHADGPGPGGLLPVAFGFEPGHVIEAAEDQLARWRRE